ncbi:hypothetical protein B7G68_08800 [Caulobacter segnis]|uniref:Uncharacterized protein n=2 Tax=Caulobacter segnis TaxID=88688 RepID=D5VG72_CAUST|nr:hypothetical protein [Caulobacter segnis]ADG10191.1 hypothetical protein Cseg_1708 [Caulobacter segnis ATCC 21756]AVQ01936.1 hypothetical protein B7G68_08800 [Caulobacter segnis]
MAEPKTVKIVERGMLWNACYDVRDGEVVVFGAYGSDRATLPRKGDPVAVAKDVLRGLVDRWEPASARRPVKRRP